MTDHLVEQRGSALRVRGGPVHLSWFRVKHCTICRLDVSCIVTEVAPEALMHLMILLADNMEGLLAVVMTLECLGSLLDRCLNASL